MIKKFWNTGIGKVAMLQWIDRTFQDYLELEHLGLTTWSGNLGMMKLAEKLRMKKEAHIQKFVIIKVNILIVLNMVF